MKLQRVLTWQEFQRRLSESFLWGLLKDKMHNLKYYKAVKGLIFCKNKFLVLEKENFVGGKFEVPGGRKDSGESDEETLKREIKEEVGLEVEIVRLLNVWYLDLPEKGIHLDGKTYLCKSDIDKVKLSKEHITYRWIEKEELKKLDCPNWLKEAISKL